MSNVIIDRYENHRERIDKTGYYKKIYRNHKHSIKCEDGIIIIELYFPYKEAVLF